MKEFTNAQALYEARWQATRERYSIFAERPSEWEGVPETDRETLARTAEILQEWGFWKSDGGE